MTLRDAPEGTHVRLTGVRLSDDVTLRLQEMGLRPGAIARVTQHAAFGGRVVAVAGSRYAIDSTTADLIDVELLDERTATAPQHVTTGPIDAPAALRP